MTVKSAGLTRRSMMALTAASPIATQAANLRFGGIDAWDLAVGNAYLGSAKRKAIAAEIFTPDKHSTEPHLDSDALRAGETIEQWLERNAHMQGDSYQLIWKTYAKHDPPKVGQQVSDWVGSWPEWREEWDIEAIGDAEMFRHNDTILSWADRVALSLQQRSTVSYEETKSSLIGMARISKPQLGEDIRSYV